MKSRPFCHLVRSPAGAFLTLLVLLLLAPRAARAGCSHLALSRDDLARLSFLDATLDRDLLATADLPTSPPDGRGCSGFWCSGAPAIPLVPSGAFEGRLGLWACKASSPDEAAAGPSFLDASADPLRPVHRASSIFHPPRRALLA
ncbi:MAG: hypothetical protein ACYC61_17195 [Isosphaeraceae bacterium]